MRNFEFYRFHFNDLTGIDLTRNDLTRMQNVKNTICCCTFLNAVIEKSLFLFFIKFLLTF